jgi:hypothetical protein
VAYVYCDYGDAEKQTPVDVIGTLLNQAMSALSETERDEFIQRLKGRRKANSDQKMTLEDTCDFLSQTLRKFNATYIFIDGLDYCMDNYKKNILSSLRVLLDDSAAKRSILLFLTGRPHMRQLIDTHVPSLGLPVSYT